MSQRFMRFLLWFSVIMITNSKHHQNSQLLLDFTCATAKDELEKHPEMRTIAMVELENNFPSEFSREVLKCLPADVAKVIINPHNYFRNASLKLPKETMVIYIADVVKAHDTFNYLYFHYIKNHPIVHHLSKRLIVSSDRTKINETKEIFWSISNVVQIFEENQKVIARSFDMTRNLTTFETFESSQRENLSQILFPDKTKNFNRKRIYAVWFDTFGEKIDIEGNVRPINKWISYVELIVQRLNATLELIKIQPSGTSWEALQNSRNRIMTKLLSQRRLDFYLNFENTKFDLESYNNEEWCFLVPLPEPFSITELILFMPMDKSCWMWLGITIAVSTLIWRISEGHWNFAFGAFSYFMGQAQLSVRIRTNRLTMKILLQLLIFAIFIFSNGYQSLVTSFMLNPVRIPLLKTVDDILDSDLKLHDELFFRLLYQDNPKFQKAKSDGRIMNIEKEEGWMVDILENLQKFNLVLIQPCKYNKIRIETEGDGKTISKIYMVTNPVFILPEDLYVRPFHPLLDSFQELMDRSLEAGLHQAWERFFWHDYRDAYYNRTEAEKAKEILDFGLIIPFFLILAFGFGAAVIALLCEIFWKDFMTQLTEEYFRRKRNEIQERMGRINII